MPEPYGMRRSYAYWRAHRVTPWRGDKPCVYCGTLMLNVTGNKFWCSVACRDADPQRRVNQGRPPRVLCPYCQGRGWLPDPSLQAAMDYTDRAIREMDSPSDTP